MAPRLGLARALLGPGGLALRSLARAGDGLSLRPGLRRPDRTGADLFYQRARDLWTTGRTKVAYGILLGMAAACIGTFAAIRLGVAPKIFWMGPNAVVGGVLFGLGIVLAGGCETGWMYRAMEGQMHFWVVGVGNVIGGTLVAAFWDELGGALALPYPKLNLLELFGPVGGLLVTYLGLALSLALVAANARRFSHARKTR